MNLWCLGAFGIFKIKFVVDKLFILVGGTSPDVQNTIFSVFGRRSQVAGLRSQVSGLRSQVKLVIAGRVAPRSWGCVRPVRVGIGTQKVRVRPNLSRSEQDREARDAGGQADRRRQVMAC